jgi:hypothetical protein
MTSGRRRNWLLKTALFLMSVVLALFGILGWAHKADVFTAVAADAADGGLWAGLDPLWPIYAVAAVGCVAAQIIAACAAVNFAWLDGAGRVWRALAGAFYVVCVLFAAYSADLGAQAILSSAQRAAADARDVERTRLTDEIAALNEVIAGERAKMSAPGTVGPQTRASETEQFLAATKAELARLPIAQQTLDALPPLPRETELSWYAAAGVFLIFLAWAVLEPWGYALAERGRQAPPRFVAGEAPPFRTMRLESRPSLLRRAAAWFSLAVISQGVAPALASANPTEEPCETPQPVTQPAAIDAKAKAFSMRGREDVAVIAAKVGVHPSTIYRWFAKRDAELAKQRDAVASRTGDAQGVLAI